MRNIITLRQTFGSLVQHTRRMATTADIFEGIIRDRHKPVKFESEPPQHTTYGGRFIVTMLTGIGTGPQMMKYVREVFESAYVPVDFEIIDDAYATEAALSSIRRNGVAIKGHIPSLTEPTSNVTLRSDLDLYVYQVHCTSYPNVRSRIPNIDIHVFRQNTEGEYSMLEHESKLGIVESLKIITKENTERFARWAFDFAKQEGRKKVTIVHKANIMKLSDGLFLRTVLDIAKDYPMLKTEDLIVDHCCMQIVSDPSQFDVILTPNLYGNIVISIICGLSGGPGLISGQNFGNNCAAFEIGSRHLAFHDKTYVNPIAMLNASVNLLYYLKKDHYADLISEAIRKTLVEQKIHTPDIGGDNTGTEVVESIKENIKAALDESKIRIFAQ